MNYEKGKNYIKIYDKEDFNPEHILECGQVFCFEKINDNKYIVFPGEKYAEITNEGNFYLINTEDVDFFENWFDLKTDYGLIKTKLSSYEILKEPIKFGHGIRILNQDLFEVLISFIISANNNIKRIKLILNNLRKNLGKQIKNNIYSFPTYQTLKECSVDFFKQMGAGYRCEYLFKVLRQIDIEFLQNLKELNTTQLRNNLLKFCGVGPKVADCVLLFGFHRGDVFPVDVWIHKMYNQFYQPLDNREKIRNNLVNQFDLLSGYAQQYLFYYQRSFIK